ncbi:MAG: NADP-dependent malic enzyme [Anaerolineae bacterium]
MLHSLTDFSSSEESEAMRYRRLYRGLVSVRSKVQVRDSTALSLVYSPGVAEPCLEIAREPSRSFDLTCRGNFVAIVSNGSAAYRLGNIGPEAILPVLESKAVILKNFAGVDALPIAIKAERTGELVDTILQLSPTFGAISMEDVVSPMCISATRRLEFALTIPIINNHMEGVAMGVLAGLINAAEVVKKDLRTMKIVINGAGAAGLGTALILHQYGARNIIVCDKEGAIYLYRPYNMNWAKWEIAKLSNQDNLDGPLNKMMEGADAYVGFVRGDITPNTVTKMADRPIMFLFGEPMSMTPREAENSGAAVVATAHSTYPNHMDVTAVLPGVFRGLLDVEAWRFPVSAQLAAAQAIADSIPREDLHSYYIYPKVIDYRVAPKVAAAVAQVILDEKLNKKQGITPADIAERTRRFVYEGQFPVPPKSEKPMTIQEESLELHERFRGMLEMNSNIPVKDEFILKQFYLMPEAMEPAELIARDRSEAFKVTARGNLVGVVTDGSAVLGLGNIGSRAAMPVMEGKAILFHTFAGVEAFPICINTQDVDEFIDTVKRLEPTFGGINLEDISAPRCFEIEERLRAEMNIPVFHDDQHGTAVVVLAGIMNACRLTGKNPAELRVVVTGAGAAGIATTKLLMALGIEDLVMVDRQGALHTDDASLNWMQRRMAEMTNPDGVKGDLKKIIKGRDVFIGVSAPGILKPAMIKSMAKDPIIFGLANPIPEVMPDIAKEAGASIVATGRSDMPNQVNNSLVFPGIFRGALDAQVANITDEMKIAAAHAIAKLVTDDQLDHNFIIPKATDFAVAPAVAEAVARRAVETGEARCEVDPAAVSSRVRQFVYEQRD